MTESPVTDRLLLIDTSVWVRYLRRGADPVLVERMHGWLGSGSAATTEIVRLELLQAARTEGEFERLSTALDALILLPAGPAAWSAAAHNAFRLRRSGLIVPTTDLLIATVAQLAGAAVAHFDNHYELVAPVLGFATVSLL